MALEDVGDGAALGRQRHENVLGGSVGVLHAVGFGLGRREYVAELGGEAHRGLAGDGAEAGELGVEVGAHGVGVHSHPLHDRHREAAVLSQHRREQVLGLHLGVAARAGQLLSGGQSFLGFERELVELHDVLRECAARAPAVE